MYGRACMAFQAGLDVNSNVSLWWRRVVLVFPSNLLNSKVRDCNGRTGKGMDSVTNMELVRTGRALSSPSLKSPAMALTRWVTAWMPEGILSFQVTDAL